MPSFLQMTMWKQKKPKAASLNNIKTPAQTALFFCTAFGKFKYIADSMVEDSAIFEVGLWSLLAEYVHSCR